MATRTIKTRLELEGDAEYRSKLRNVNAALSEQKSELKLINEQYKNQQNTAEALSKKLDALRNIQAAQTKVLEAAKDGLANAVSEENKYAAQVEVVQRKLEAAQVEMESLNTSTEEGAKRFTELRAETGKYQEELDKAKEAQSLAGESVDEWAQKQARAKTAVNNTSAQIQSYEGYLKEAESSTDKCAKSIDQYGKKAKEASGNQKQMNSALDALAATLAASGLENKFEDIRSALLECAGAAAEFETALAKVSTIADTETTSMATIKGEILDLSNETGQAVTLLSDAAYNAISAGVETAGAVKFVSTATKLATGGFTDNTTAVDILTTALNAYKLELSEAEQVSDYLITTQNLGKTTVNELASSMGKVIPIAGAYNVKMDNLSTSIAVLTANGIATAESATYLKAMLNELGDSGSKVSKTLRTETGMSFSDLMKKGYSLGDVMDILGKSVDNDTGSFNELWSSSEAGVGALSLLGAGAEKYNDVLLKMQNSAGATEKAYGQMADTTEMAQKKLTNAFENLKIAVGSELQDQMRSAYETGADLLTWASEFVQQNEWLVPVIEGVITALGLLVSGMSTYVVVTKVIIPLMVEMGTAINTAFGPVGMAVAVIGLLVSALAPLMMSMSDTTDEVNAQTNAWREDAAAIRDATNAYREQTGKIQEAAEENKSLAATITDLMAKEHRSASEKTALAGAVDSLNEKLPKLGLSYDSVKDSVNMTTGELEKLVHTMELQEKYEAAQANYAAVYSKKQQAVEDLEKAQAALSETLEENSDKIQKAHENMGYYNAGAVQYIAELTSQINSQQEAVDELESSVNDATDTLQDMTYEINLYTIETANMTEEQRKSIDAQMKEATAIQDNTPLYYERIEAIARTAEAYDNEAIVATSSMEEVMAKLWELDAKYLENYDAAYSSITQQIGLFEEMKAGTSQSVDDMINALQSQVEYMNEYAENMRLAMELGVSEGILEQLSDGSEESAAILAEIVSTGDEKITELNEQFGRVEEGKEQFSRAVAELKTYYGTEMDALVKKTTDAVQEMARYDDAYNSATQTCNGIIAGIDSKWGSVVEKYRALANAAMSAYNDTLVIKSPSKKFKWSAEMTMEGIERGVDENERAVIRKYESLAEDILFAYQGKLQEVDMTVPGAEKTIYTATPDMSVWDSKRTEGSNEKQVSVQQEINIYSKTDSIIETARKFKESQKEAATEW